MPVETKNIVGLDSDRYDNRAPDRPHYNSTPYRAGRFVFPPIWVITTFVIAALPLTMVFSWALVRLFNWVGEINIIADQFDGHMLVTVKLALALAVSIVFIGFGLLMLAFVASKLVIRLQNNMPVSLLEIVFAGTAMQELTRATLRDYAAERQTLWGNSGLWALETLDLSRAGLPTSGATPADVIDAPALPMLPSGNGNETNAEMLIRTGRINRSGNSILIGFSAQDKPHYMELAETGFVSIVGYPRVGKSSTAALIASQVALIAGAELFICDKHAHRHDSLTRRLDPLGNAITARAHEIDEISALIDRWHEIGRDRLSKTSNDQFPPLMLIIDEYTSMILLEELPEVQLRRMLSGSVEFPKVQTHGLYIAHQFTGRLMGGALGTALRRVTTQRIVMRCDTADAEFVIPDRKIAKIAPTLGEGRALHFGQTQTTPVEIGIPEFTARDIEYIARVLPVARPAQTGPFGPNVSHVADVSSAPQWAATGNAPVTNGASSSPASTQQDDSDVYARNQAITYLRKQTANGKYVYDIRAVQSMTGLRTATVVALAHSIGRRRGNDDSN